MAPRGSDGITSVFFCLSRFGGVRRWLLRVAGAIGIVQLFFHYLFSIVKRWSLGSGVGCVNNGQVAGAVGGSRVDGVFKFNVGGLRDLILS